jgi:hypothetical protein
VKRYLILAVIAAVIMLVLWMSIGSKFNAPGGSVPSAQPLAAANTSAPVDTDNSADVPATAEPGSSTISTNRDDQTESVPRDYIKYPDVPVTFYGLVVDQDTNGLQNVKVDVEVLQWDTNAPPDDDLKTAHIERQTGVDGRFEVSGLNGHSVTIRAFRKDGYEPELWRRDYGEYRSQAGGAIEPIVFRMWSTNLHEQIIAGERLYHIIPDGRRYAIDLIKGAIAEGINGDLVVWLKRPEPVTFPYAWSCGMSAPGGGLEREKDPNSLMYRAPLGEYTDVFDFQVQYNTHAKRGMSFDNRFYVKIHNGEMYGRLSVDFWTAYRDDPSSGMIKISYAINPTGSRLLR